MICYQKLIYFFRGVVFLKDMKMKDPRPPHLSDVLSETCRMKIDHCQNVDSTSRWLKLEIRLTHKSPDTVSLSGK